MFDMPPIKPWAGKERKDSARILGATSTQVMTAVLTVHDDGKFS
jgi:hypothetical protein